MTGMTEMFVVQNTSFMDVFPGTTPWFELEFCTPDFKQRWFMVELSASVGRESQWKWWQPTAHKSFRGFCYKFCISSFFSTTLPELLCENLVKLTQQNSNAHKHWAHYVCTLHSLAVTFSLSFAVCALITQVILELLWFLTKHLVSNLNSLYLK